MKGVILLTEKIFLGRLRILDVFHLLSIFAQRRRSFQIMCAIERTNLVSVRFSKGPSNLSLKTEKKRIYVEKENLISIKNCSNQMSFWADKLDLIRKTLQI